MTTAHVDAAAGEDGHVRVTLAGEVDLSNADAVEEALVAAISNDATDVSVDMADVEYLDSAGLRLLYSLAARLATLQIRLELLVPPASPARRVVELSGLGSVARLVPEDPSPPV